MTNDNATAPLSVGYAQRIRDLMAEMMRGEFAEEEDFVSRAGDVMTALVSETANAAAALTVQRGLDPDVLANATIKNFIRFYEERLDTLQRETVTVQ